MPLKRRAAHNKRQKPPVEAGLFREWENPPGSAKRDRGGAASRRRRDYISSAT
jgi:hypothetical protein